MADFVLKAQSALDGYDRDFGGTRLSEPADLAIVSLAIPQGDEAACTKALKAAYGSDLPDSGASVLANDGAHRIVRTQADQAFVLFTHATPDARDVVHAATKGAFYSTDQSDAWCALTLSGPQARAALERLSMLDLHPSAFALNAAARTVMEHMGAMILRTGDDEFLLLSARSSAKSFLHAVETSVTNVL